jgi:hypothetical protein
MAIGEAATDTGEQALDRLLALALDDPGLLTRLRNHPDRESFAKAIVAAAMEHGIHLSADTLDTATCSDPLGLSRWTSSPAIDAHAPPDGSLPIAAHWWEGQFCVDWADFGDKPLGEPFFEDSIRRAMRDPFNKMFQFRSSLQKLVERTESNPGLEPSGFIFHMSRCGSTLVSQMLAALPENVVISEAAPIDAVLQLRFTDDDTHVRLLRAMVGAFARKRTGRERHCFIKLDSWHTLALPLFRRAFPSVPWIFLYREPGEVIASQLQQRGIQTVPEYISPAMFGLEAIPLEAPEDYCARVFGKTCEAVLEPFAQGGGLLVNYAELPGALWTKIMPHFGVDLAQSDRAAMAERAVRDSKSPGMPFLAEDDRARKAAITKAHTASAAMGGIYRELEALRCGPSAT